MTWPGQLESLPCTAAAERVTVPVVLAKVSKLPEARATEMDSVTCG